ncbi:nitroreductase [Venatoribacter cucullus]|uniref:Putative NAD(P)H nitroreductase n=1 Tax=Venatoribacter cucullus TaxID=2661630 RepID=A0A9X7YMY0_9GAMM|nr:nitroreductase [Venatoribacter cucullus]QQD21381.1 nitroreductase [Oceanospirillaceae bacterium ASx5O]QQD24060.1 nitroreductase [Venatoribacter cucullus]
MHALDVLTQRVSIAQLSGPDITTDQQEMLIRAALRAADHAWLRPSRYLTVQGAARSRLGEIFLQATPDWQQLPADKQQKLLNAPLRAPLVIVAICRVQEHPKVPALEQLLSTGAGVQNMLNAAWALGLGAIWRSGDVAHNPAVAAALGLAANEQIVGFIYVGHPNTTPKAVPELEVRDFVTAWEAKTL